MDAAGFDRFLRDVAARSTRRGLGGLAVGAVASLALIDEARGKGKKSKKKGKGKGNGNGKGKGKTNHPDVEICHEGRPIFVPFEDVQSHLEHGDSAGPCPSPPPPPPPPPPPLPGVPGPSCWGVGAGSFGNVRRIAQVFTSDKNGLIDSMGCTLTNPYGWGVDFEKGYTLDIRLLDESGVPSSSVIAQNFALPGPADANGFPINASFMGVEVTAGSSYAFTITASRPGVLWVMVGNNTCSGQIYSDLEATDSFVAAGSSDMMFHSRMRA